MLKKLCALAAALCLFAGAVYAESPLVMAFETDDGAVSEMDARALSLSVVNDKLMVSNANESREFELHKLVKMYFTAGSTGLEVVGMGMSDSGVTVFSTDGKAVGQYASLAEAMSALPVGLYIVKTADSKSFKIAVQ